MPASLYDYLSIRRHPTGRMVFALGKTRLVASEEREPGLITRVDKAVTHGRSTLALERKWDGVRVTRSSRRGDAAIIDIEFDNAWKTFASLIQGQVFGPPDDPVRKAAEEVLANAFPLGVSAVTQKSYELQLEAADSILGSFDEELAPHAKLLGLTRHLDGLKSIGGRFRIELEREEKPLAWSTVAASKVRTQELYAGVILNILGRYPDDDAASVERREALLSEVNRQDALLRDLYRRHRPALDVDADTGEVLGEQTPVSEVDAA